MTDYYYHSPLIYEMEDAYTLHKTSFHWDDYFFFKKSQYKHNDEPTIIQRHDDVESTLIQHSVIVCSRIILF